jgi:hypothetical protein
MKAVRVLIAVLVVSGIAGSVPAASAKKHHKSHSMSMTKGAGMNGMKDPNAKPNPDATGQGTVGPRSDNGSMKK